jgi:hypothetical protein
MIGWVVTAAVDRAIVSEAVRRETSRESTHSSGASRVPEDVPREQAGTGVVPAPPRREVNSSDIPND